MISLMAPTSPTEQTSGCASNLSMRLLVFQAFAKLFAAQAVGPTNTSGACVDHQCRGAPLGAKISPRQHSLLRTPRRAHRRGSLGEHTACGRYKEAQRHRANP